jgi:hypothetical protein
MKIHQSLPQNEAFFGYYARLIPTLFKVGFLSQAFSACIEIYILYSILRPKFQGVTDYPGEAALFGSLLLVALLEVGLRTSAAFSVRAILHRKFSGLDLPMTAFIFILSGSLLLCSVVLHLEGSKEAVEANNAGPVLEQTAHIETSGQTEAAALLRSFSQDSATIAATYSSRLKATRAAESAKERAYLSKKGATAGGAAIIRAKGAEMLANIEAERGAKFEALLERKSSQVERVKGRQYSAEDEANGRNKVKLQKDETRVAKYSSYLSIFSVLTVLFFLLTIALNEIHKKGSGIEEVAIAHQYQFEQPVFAKLQTAVNAKFQYHARRAIDRIEESTPEPGAPLTPHPLYDWGGLTPRRVAMQTRERKGATNSANSGAGNNANRPAGDGRKQEPYLNGHTGKNGGGDDGGLFVATKQTPGGGGSENSTTNGSRETEANGRPPVIIRQEKAEQTPGTFSANSAAGGRDVFYFVDKEKAAHTIEHNGKHYTLRDVNSFVTTYTKRAEEARKLKNEDVLRARLEMVAYWQSRREELLQVMQLAG